MRDLPGLPAQPGSLFALADDPRDMPNMYLNVGSRPGDHNGGEVVEVHLTLRALQDGTRLESDFRPGWCSIRQLHQAPSVSDPLLCPGAQVKPNTLILDDNVVIILACHDGMTLNLCVSGPAHLLNTPLNAEAWHWTAKGAKHVLIPEES